MAADREHSIAAGTRAFEEASVATLTAVTFLALAQGARPGHGREFRDGHPLPVMRTADGGYRSIVAAGRRGLEPLHIREACRRAARELYPDRPAPRSRWLNADPPKPANQMPCAPIPGSNRLRKQ